MNAATSPPAPADDRYRALLDAIDEGFCVIDVLFDGDAAVDYRFVEVNAAFERQTGLGDPVGRRIREIAPAHDGSWVEAYGRVARTGEPVRAERWAGLLGRWLDLYAFKINHGHRDRVGVLFRDVTGRRRVEEELRFRDRAIRACTQGLVITDAGRADNPLVYVSPGFEQLTGYPAAEAVGRNCRFLQGPGTDPEGPRRIRDAVRAGQGATVEVLNYRRDGTPFWNEVGVSPVHEGDRVTHFVGVITDVTERRRVQERLREQEAMLREAAELAHVGGWSFDPSTGKSDWTEETFRIHNLDPAAGAESVEQGLDRFPGEGRGRVEPAVRRAIVHGTPYDLELDFVAADGERKRVRSICRPVVEGGRVVRVRGTIQDVTARHRLEEQYRQSQKMDAFGQLAGGVAHDFNNMLQVINGFAELALEGLPPGDPRELPLREIWRAGERSAALTRQLLAFARQEAAAPRAIDVGAVAAGTAEMLRRLIGEGVRLETDLPEGLWPVHADPGQVEQVLMNLAVNARDAMPGGGTLTVSARNERVADPDAAGATAGPHVVLSVADTGTGMPPEVAARAFEPFFTTKGIGKGAGLGLATVYGIVRQSGGHVRVRSAAGEGSTFEVLLPRREWAAAGAAPDAGARAMPRGTETVLVVEDDAAVRSVVRMVLTECGYAVLEAGDVLAAAEAARGHAGPIHLVLSDVVMPGAGGRAAVERVRARHPGARQMYMSGYAADAVTRGGLWAAEAPFLQKPFTPSTLAVKVREALDAPGDAG